MTSTNDFIVRTDTEAFDLDMIFNFLHNDAYWCQGIPRETVAIALENSLCFGVFQGAVQVGFGRLITDHATFGNLVDVFVLPEYRGQGAARVLIEAIMAHPSVTGLRRLTLATADMHALYSKFGFEPLKQPERFMQVHRPDVYKPR